MQRKIVQEADCSEDADVQAKISREENEKERKRAFPHFQVL